MRPFFCTPPRPTLPPPQIRSPLHRSSIEDDGGGHICPCGREPVNCGSGPAQTFFVFNFDILFLFHHLRYMIACAGFSETWLVQYQPRKAGVGRGCSLADFFLLVKKKWPLEVPPQILAPR
nr:hypothetical protein [Morchella crassipes]